MKTVAALFVQNDGCYSNIDFIDAWSIERDARLYSGPYPVVAHPPCQLWGALAYVNYKRWGGEHNRPGNDGGCFESALNNVRKYGGVLEHPAKTRAWERYGLRKPTFGAWSRSDCGGWVCEVWQSAYGHRANKATWLYYFGKMKPFDLIWERKIGSHQIGFYDQRGKSSNKPTLTKREANATPIAFRDVLIKLALFSSFVKKEHGMTEKMDEKIVRAVDKAIANIADDAMVTQEIEDIENVSKKKWKVAATHAISVAASYKKQLDALNETTLRIPFVQIDDKLILADDFHKVFSVDWIIDGMGRTIKRVSLTMKEARDMGYEK